MRIRNWILALLVIVSLVALIWYLGIYYGLVIGLLWNALLLVLTNLDRVMDIIASSYKIGRKASFWFEKNAVEKRLEATINLASKKVNKEAGEFLPHGIDIQWVESEDREAFLKEGKIVVCLESSYNEERNLARATVLYVDRDLVPESQRFVDNTVMKSLIFSISRKMLMLERKIGALKCLNEEFVDPEIQRKPDIRVCLIGIDNIDKQGMLTRILLRQFSQLDAKLSPSLTDPKARDETKEFTFLLTNFSEREEGERSELDFNGSILQVSLIPVARLGVDFDIKRFIRRASICHSEGIDTIYILARGMNIVLGKIVTSEIEKAHLYNKNAEWEFEITGLKKPALKVYISELTKV